MRNLGSTCTVERFSGVLKHFSCLRLTRSGHAAMFPVGNETFTCLRASEKCAEGMLDFMRRGKEASAIFALHTSKARKQGMLRNVMPRRLWGQVCRDKLKAAMASKLMHADRHDELDVALLRSWREVLVQSNKDLWS